MGTGWGGEGHAFMNLGNDDNWSDVFISLTSSSAVGVSPEIIKHYLGVNPEVTIFNIYIFKSIVYCVFIREYYYLNQIN